MAPVPSTLTLEKSSGDARLSTVLGRDAYGRSAVSAAAYSRRAWRGRGRHDLCRAPRAVHGKTDEITHDGQALFAGIPSPPVSVSDLSQLRFASPADGYAFGPELWQTADGSWESSTSRMSSKKAFASVLLGFAPWAFARS